MPEPPDEFKSMLENSAFTPAIYSGMPLDYYMPGIQATQQYFSAVVKGRVKPKFYMLHDSYMMFYHPSDRVAEALKKNQPESAWQRIARNIVSSREYLELNEITRHSMELSALASAKLLGRILSVLDLDKVDQKLKSTRQGQQGRQQGKDDLSIVDDTVNDAIRDAVNTVKEYVRLRGEAGDSETLLAGSGSGFSHGVLSALTFLENPDEFRKRVKLLKLTAVIMKKLLPEIPASLSYQQQVSLFGGVSGVTRMTRESQIKDLLPQELAILKSPAIPENISRTILALRILSKQSMVVERSATLKPVVFIDKSGSMADLDTEDGVPKIALAAGLALALHRKLNGDIYLFDTEVEKVKPSDVVKTLLTVKADGGTNITRVLQEIVLQEILRVGRRDNIYIIITDALDAVRLDVVDEVKRRGLADRIRFIIIPSSASAYAYTTWIKNFKYTIAKNIAEFTTASKEALKT